MAASNSGGGGGPISAQAAAALGEGIKLVFGRWTALQMAVENQWGGRDSRVKADQFGESIHSWFCRSRGPHYFEDLVDMMYENISDSFNADFEDNSVEEVAEQLLIIHEECMQSNYSSIERLRNSHVQGNAVSQSRQQLMTTTVIAQMMTTTTRQWWKMKQQLHQRRWWWTDQDPPSQYPTLMGGPLCLLSMVVAPVARIRQGWKPSCIHTCR
ncbi:unnamed protein product [Urochloa decumbens]|uniref:Pre-rRNA-processing protein TSR2 homolog n=1 Tax=Urochloa decumbens TaxID=240449 RepID=A0ABC9A2U3_9POAL